ncbi:hypothetical protein CJ430_31265, partial [Klebsiella pneumoniae]
SFLPIDVKQKMAMIARACGVIDLVGGYCCSSVGMLTPHWMYESFLPIDVKQKMAMIARACGVIDLVGGYCCSSV